MDTITEIKTFVLDLADWSRMMFMHVWQMLSGVAVGGTIFVVERQSGNAIPWSTIVAAIFAGFLLAAFSTWRVEHARVRELSVIRSKYLSDLKLRLSDGRDIDKALRSADVTDAEVDALTIKAEEWATDVSKWMRRNMGYAAVAKFDDRSEQKAFVVSGGHLDQDHRAKRNANLVWLASCLKNLEAIAGTNVYDRD